MAWNESLTSFFIIETTFFLSIFFENQYFWKQSKLWWKTSLSALFGNSWTVFDQLFTVFSRGSLPGPLQILGTLAVLHLLEFRGNWLKIQNLSQLASKLSLEPIHGQINTYELTSVKIWWENIENEDSSVHTTWKLGVGFAYLRHRPGCSRFCFKW